MASFNFTTGPSTLPDVGQLMYNGCTFSPLFESSVSGTVVKDNAGRTTKFMEYTITVDGYVTLPPKAVDTDGTVSVLRRLLTAHAGTLVYKGRGMNIVVNIPGTPVKDVAWGPVPELFDFQTLGGGRSAKVTWRVKTRIPEIPEATASRVRLGPVLQFNEETVVTYDEAGYSQLAVRGTLEIPLTRATQTTRNLTYTVDNYRAIILNEFAASFDLKKFRVVHREFNVSRDKRTLEWSFALEELPYMGMPPDVTIARGTFNFRPVKAGAGLVNWLCTLRVTYTVRKDRPRRTAWLAFLALLRERMAASVLSNIPPPDNPGIGNIVGTAFGSFLTGRGITVNLMRQIMEQQIQRVNSSRSSILIDFSVDEGLYLDSRTVSFSATWRLITTFSHILLASGLWRRAPEDGGEFWATSMRSISGAVSWLPNTIDPTKDAIVDFGDSR